MKFAKFSTKYLLTILSICIILTLVGCNDPKKQQTQEQQTNKRILTIGLIPEYNLFRQKDRYKPLADFLSQETDVIIKLKIFPRYGDIVKSFIDLELDGAFLGSFTFALINSKLDIKPVVRPERRDGSSTYYGIVFARKDSGINDVQAMRNTRFAFVDKVTTAGYLLPLNFFKLQGVTDYNSWFKETYFTGTHEDAIFDVLNKRADAGAAKSTVYYRLAAEDKRITGNLKILAESPHVPENSLVFKNSLDPLIIKEIKNTLLAMHTSTKGVSALAQLDATKFVESKSEDYKSVNLYAQKMGIDLATYKYLGD